MPYRESSSNFSEGCVDPLLPITRRRSPSCCLSGPGFVHGRCCWRSQGQIRLRLTHEVMYAQTRSSNERRPTVLLLMRRPDHLEVETIVRIRWTDGFSKLSSGEDRRKSRRRCNTGSNYLLLKLAKFLNQWTHKIKELRWVYMWNPLAYSSFYCLYCLILIFILYHWRDNWKTILQNLHNINTIVVNDPLTSMYAVVHWSLYIMQ